MKFLIRDLLWLTAVVALGVAWWVDRRIHAAKVADGACWQARATALSGGIEENGGTVVFEADRMRFQPTR